jgi:hypothetical protein
MTGWAENILCRSTLRGVAGDQFAHGPQRHAIGLDRARRQRMRQDAARRVEQVYLDCRVDDHGALRQQGQGRFVDHAVFDQLHLAGYVHRDRGVQALGYLLVIKPGAEMLYGEKGAADQADDQHQRDAQAGEQGMGEIFEHGG